jgi:hypothetical protein
MLNLDLSLLGVVFQWLCKKVSAAACSTIKQLVQQQLLLLLQWHMNRDQDNDNSYRSDCDSIKGDNCL